MARYFSLMRAGNCALASAGVFAGHTIVSKSIALSPQLLLGMACAFVITAAGNIINDYFDTGIDERLGRKKLGGEKERANALLLSAIMFVAGIGAAYLINRQAFAIAAIVSALLILYSGVMQNFKFLGNYVVALGTALTLVFGAAIAQEYYGIVLIAGSAFFANAAREIIKDMGDVEGDRGIKLTLPMIASFAGIKKIVLFAYIGAVSFGIIALTGGILAGGAYLALLAIAAALFLHSFLLLSGREFALSQKFAKIGMAAALLSFIAGAL